MKTCPVDFAELRPALTRQGVEIDVCPSCSGIWLDRDEIYHFCKVPQYARARLEEGLRNKRPTQRKSPVTGRAMVEVPLWGGETVVDYCEESGGIWFDQGELQRFPVEEWRLQIDPGVSTVARSSDIAPPADGMFAPDAPRPELIPLPNLTTRSASVLFGMYAILTLVLIACVEFLGVSPGFALLAGIVLAGLQFLISPFIMDLTLSWLYRMTWVAPSQLPPHLADFITRVCEQQGIRFPRMGIIQDGAPQAFTYGHHPNNGRIVISQGILDLLQEKEAEAVVAHEIGHMVHWDMLVMTLAQLVPMLLYYIYRTLIRMRSRGRDKSAGARMAVAIGAYVLYLISEYVVLWFSRIREYYADRFSGQVTGEPEHLASALVKIGYGLAGREPETTSSSTKRSDALHGLQPLGIFNAKQAQQLAATSGPRKMGGEIDKQTLKDAAKWELWNPWAAYFELHSTHPLIAKRIQMLSNLSMSMGRAPYISFHEQRPESYWDNFLLDILIYLLPAIALGGGALLYVLSGGSQPLLAATVFMLGASFLAKILFSYPSSGFVPMTVKGLLKKIKVSAITPVPCVIKGVIVGKGVPGLIYSEDFVLQDDTGIIFLDYRQPLSFFTFLFGLLQAQSYQGQRVEVTGWYRRAPIPYIEIKELRTDVDRRGCYIYQAKMAAAVLLMAAGVFLLFV